MRYIKLAAVLSCSVSTIAAASTAYAQTVESEPESEPSQDSREEGATEQDGDSGPAIVVTGSRIARRDYVSQSPIVTVGQDSIASVGSPTLEGSLNQLPQIVTSAGASSSRNSRAGQSNVNLRGLGQQRTLVLVNSRRMQPSSSDGTVDLNLIPTALIENVEVITGGASSTYGSDAVAGVVNIKLRKRFNGIQVDTLNGATFHGDGRNSSIGLTVGSDFADRRGNAYLSVNFADRSGIQGLDRDYLSGQVLTTSTPGGLISAVSSNLPTQAAVNQVFASYGFAPGRASRSATFSLNTDGTLYVGTGALNYRLPRTTPYAVYNGSAYTSAGDYYLAQIPLTRLGMVGHVDYQVTDSVTFFVDALFTNYHATNAGPAVVVGSASSAPISIPATNPFISPDLRAILASRPNPNAEFFIAQQIPATGNRIERNEYDVYQVTAGAEGELKGGDLTWNVSASYGKTRFVQTLRNYPSSFAVSRLLWAPDGGASICAGGYDFTNVFSLSQSCTDYIKREARNVTELSQTVVEANVQGRAFDLPAGPLRFAVGADYRGNTYSFRPDAMIESGELGNFLPIFGSRGSEDVKEVYGELLVPLLHDLPLIDEVNLNIGYRYSDYKASGPVHTYKIDADWSVTSFLRFRGGYARAVRAPSVGELYAASSTGLVPLGPPGTLGSGDPCDFRSAYLAPGSANAAQVRTLCLAQGVPANTIDSFQNSVSRTPFTTAGNVNLEPEKSDTYSVGFVIRSLSSSPLLSRLTLSVDYYNIELTGAVGVVTNLVATSQCFSPETNPGLSASNFYCALITRDPNTGLITNIDNPLLNLGGYKTAGVDVAVDWSFPLEELGLGAGAGTLSLSGVVSHLDSFVIQTLPSGAKLDYAGTIGNQQVDIFATARPKWKATSTVGWRVGPLQTSFRWRYLGGMSSALNVGTGGTARGVSSVSYYDIDVNVNISDDFELRGGIANLLDRKPPRLFDNYVGNAATDLYTYDLIGRRFYLSSTFRF